MANNQTNGSQVERVNGHAVKAADRAREAAVSVVDLPVGTALSVVDRFNEISEPWRSRVTATDEIKNIRHQFTREVTKLERRGGTARRNAVQRVQRTRNRVERQAEERLQGARTRLGV
jgi:seryl-tRNA synthetase